MADQSPPESESSPTVEVGDVRFEGQFRPEERAALAAQFSACRFRIVERSVLGGGAVLVEWEGGSATVPREAPRPLFAAPRRALYVLELADRPSDPPQTVPASDQSGGAYRPGVRRGSAASGPPAARLERIDSAAELAARYPGQFPTARVRTDWRDRLRRMMRDVWPALMLAVATVWVLALAWTCRA